MTITYRIAIGILIALALSLIATQSALATHIGTADLANGAVTSAKIANGTITGIDIANNSIRSIDIADNAVGPGEIINGGVRTEHILNGTIRSIDIGDDQIGPGEIIAGAVGTSEIADGTIATADIADSAVTSAKIADGGVATADLADLSVTTAKLAADAVTSAKIADGTIATADLAAGAVDSAAILDGTIATADVAANAITDALVVDTITASNYLPLTGGDINGVLRTINDNATSFRLRGPSDLDGDGVSDSTSESYAGIFYNAVYDDTGGTGAKTTRAIWGSNEDMDLEFQGSNQIRITAVDDNVGTGRIRLAAEEEIQFHVYGDGVANAETDALLATMTSTGLTLASGKDLTATGAVDFSGASSLKIPKGAGLAAAGNCAVVADQGKLFFATTTAGAMLSGTAYVCTSDAGADGTHDDYAWEALN